MLPLDHPDRIQITFDDRRLVANAGLLLPVTLAQHLGLRELVDHHLDLGNAPGRANAGDKMLTLVASALAGGDCIDDADVLRTGGTAQTLGCVVKAPSTLGTFLRSFRWGHVRQLDRVSRELLARAWSAGAGPGDAPFTIDLDSTICETYGLAKEGARDHGYTGKRGYHPLLAVAAGTGDVLMARLREGRANTARGAAYFLRETVGRVRYAGARGQLTVRADSGFYTHAIVAACRRMDVRFSITVRQSASLRSLRGHTPAGLDAHPLLDGRRRRRGRNQLHSLPEQARRRAGAAHRPAREAHARFPVGPLRHLQLSRLSITDREGETLELGPTIGATPRSRMHPRPQVRRGAQPSPLGPLPRQRRLAGGAGDRPQPGMDGAASVWVSRSDHQDPATPLLFHGRKAHPLGAPPHFASAPALALGSPQRLDSERCLSPPDGARPPLIRPTEPPRASLAASYPAISLATTTVGRHRRPQKRLQTAANPPSTRIRARTIAFVISSHPLPVFSLPQSVSIGGFGLTPPWLRCTAFNTPDLGKVTGRC